jgi:hypothetical protein
MADVDKETNCANAVEYAKNQKKICQMNGLNNRIVVEEKYFDFERIVLVL